MRKLIIGALVALLVCATGIFACFGHHSVDKDPENEKDPVWSVPYGDAPIG